ncbi:MAG: hypothetical protein NUV85_04070, partial [Candidatus Berkelbacteria bacterium]|nr:hypothetical protein [Candidatus Berkelbacteria bacterium]
SNHGAVFFLLEILAFARIYPSAGSVEIVASSYCSLITFRRNKKCPDRFGNLAGLESRRESALFTGF